MKILSLISAFFLIISISASAQNVGIGQTNPKSKLDVNGGVTIGTTYSGTSPAPPSGAIIQGQVGIGNATPSAQAILDLTNSSHLGIVLPTVPTASLPATPIAGYTAYNSTTGCLQFYNGTAWTYITSGLLASAVSFTANPSSATLGNTGIVYSVTAGAASYSWTIPSGWTVTAGSTSSNTITVSLPPNNTSVMATYGGNQTVSCAVTGACSSSNTLSQTVLVHGTQQFTTTGAATATVPTGITSLTVDMAGGGGGGIYSNLYTVATNTADAGRIQASINVTSGGTLNLYVGAKGGTATATAGGTGGTNGTTSAGGNGVLSGTTAYVNGSGGYTGVTDASGGGGAASEIQISSTRVLVAGGGGGEGQDDYYGYSCYGGAGTTAGTGTGAVAGANGGYGNSATQEGIGGSTTAGGTAVTYSVSSSGTCVGSSSGAGGGTASGAGGNGGAGYAYKSSTCYNNEEVGGGGGGGYTGGSGGVGGGGGGGSSYANATYVSGSATFSIYGTALANGYIYLTW